MEARHYIDKSIRYLVYSNLWISISVGLWTFLSFYSLGHTHEFGIPLFTGFSTLLTYNYQRILKSQRSTGEYVAGRNNWILRNKKSILYLAVFGGIGTACFALFLNFDDLIFLVIPGILSLLYVVPEKYAFIPSLRDIPYIKIHLIALSWVCACYLLPHIHVLGFEVFYSSSLWFGFMEKYFFILAITIPFDIRDLKFDSPKKKTIPQVVGVETAIVYSIILLMGACAFVVVNETLTLRANISYASALLISYVVTILIVLQAKEDRKELYYSGLLDATPMMQFVLVYLIT